MPVKPADDSGMRSVGRGSPKNAVRNEQGSELVFNLPHSEALSQPLKQAGGHSTGGWVDGEEKCHESLQ